MPSGLGSAQQPIVLGNESKGKDSSVAPPPISRSLLAHHLASAPAPGAFLRTAPSHLSQLLQQPPANQGATGGGSGAPGTSGPSPWAEFEATHFNPQRIFQKHQKYLEEQNQLQQQQQRTRAAQLQAEQAAMAAAVSAASAPNVAQEAPPTSSSSSAAAQEGATASSSSQAAIEAQIRNNPILAFANPEDLTHPSLLPLSMFRIDPNTTDADMEKMNTGELCQYARELVSEVNMKTSMMATLLKKVMERKPLLPGEDPTEPMARCDFNLKRIMKIRTIIEKRRGPEWKRLTGDDYIEMMLDESELGDMSDEQKEKRAELAEEYPRIMSKTAPRPGHVYYQGRWMPKELRDKYEIFEKNKAELIAMADDLKALKWEIDVSNPQHLKRVDQTKISKKRPDLEQPYTES